MKLCTKPALALLALSSLLAGCGAPVTNEACSYTATANTTVAGPDFTLSPLNPDLSIYPGQTETVAFQVLPVGTATGAVTVGPDANLPYGLTVSSVTATIGSTVNLTVKAAPDVVTACFTGALGTYTASVAVPITASDAHGSIGTNIPMYVTLQNPSFVPTTTNLPVLKIVTAGGVDVTSKDDYVDATLTITDPTNSANNYSGTMEIKGHGNTTWQMPKKPYRLNLDKKAALLGMQSDTNWILLANYDDKPMLRTDVSMQMSREFGMFWTPTQPFVEVYLNGIYWGTYQLSEKVEVSKARLNIGSIDPGDDSGADVTGGYLGEIDHYAGETLMIRSIARLPIGLADPDPPDATQAAYWTSALYTAERSLYLNNFTDPTVGWPAYWDSASMVNYFMVEEIAGNGDAGDFSSDYFYKPRSDNFFYRGPVWDMDVTFGNANYGSTADSNTVILPTHAAWYQQLFRDPAFVALIKARWTAIRPQVLALSTYIDQRAAALTQAEANDKARWPTLGEKVWPNAVATGSFQGEVNYMKTWLASRIAYMDRNYSQ